MKTFFWKNKFSRRGFLKGTLAWIGLTLLPPFNRTAKGAPPDNPLFWVKDIPDYPFCTGGSGNDHVGTDALLRLMGDHGLKFYRSSQETAVSGPSGMIQPNDVVLIKVNAQWKYRGCTNSDLIRGLIQAILDHPDGFNGEVVILENGQGWGSLNCDTSSAYSGDPAVHANANDENQSFLYLVQVIFNDPRVSAFLLDPIRFNFIAADDHSSQGYRRYENVSYPCFTTAGNHRVELREGIWQGSGYGQNLKLINVPVLKYHDTGGSEITASLKHFYGLVSMADGQSAFRHYSGLGQTCGKMVLSVRTPVLNIIDATWVSFSSITGYPSTTTHRANQILASQDPVALDYWAAKYIFYPITANPRHLPTFSGIDQWLTSAREVINGGSLYNPDSGIMVDKVTKIEGEMLAYNHSLSPWRSLPGSTPSAPALAWNPIIPKIQMMVRGQDNAIWTATFDSSGVFNEDWIRLTGATPSGPGLAWIPAPANKMLMVVRGMDNSIWKATFDSSGVFNGDWMRLTGVTPSEPDLAWIPAPANKMLMVVRGMDNSIWKASFDSNGVFNGDWTRLSGATPSAPALAWNPGYPGGARMQMVVRGLDDSIWTGTIDSTGAFQNDWAQIPGGILSGPALIWNPASPGGARMQIVVRGLKDSIWSGTMESNGTFNAWTPLPGAILSAPALAWNETAQELHAVIRGSRDALWAGVL